MRSVVIHLPVTRDPPPEGGSAPVLRLAAEAAGIGIDEVSAVILRRRSLDARKRRAPVWVLRCDVFDAGERPPPPELPPLLRPRRLARPGAASPIIVGMGPAGLFAALVFAEAGLRCTLLDRGSAVDQRNVHIRELRRGGVLRAESNLCFGEGGAGTYSDGKLYTRSKSPRVHEVYERLVALGLTPRILVDAHPHVGTNRLIPMAHRLRDALLEAGHALRFDARVDDLVVEGGVVRGVRLADGSEVVGGPVLLATGHSARDTYRMLARLGVAMARKPFAVGARVEHPQDLVDRVQLGPLAGNPAVGPAEYFVSHEVRAPEGSRGVYSFCMCPGGWVLPTPTAPDHLNVNGMSNSNRGSPWANAALVRQVQAEDLYLERPGDLDGHPELGAHVAAGALLGLALQSELERRAFRVGGGGYRAHAQRLVDLAAGRPSGSLPRSSYRPGLTPADLREVLPSRLIRALVDASRGIDAHKLRGYLSSEAVVIAVETTTSSPVRVLRGDDRQSPTHPGLYPVAEGAGYAGGIVSSAIDGMITAEVVLGGLR